MSRERIFVQTGFGRDAGSCSARRAARPSTGTCCGVSWESFRAAGFNIFAFDCRGFGRNPAFRSDTAKRSLLLPRGSVESAQAISR